MSGTFDLNILHFLNQFAQRSWLFDKSMVFLSTDPFVSGGVATSFFWWAWFTESSRKDKIRETILCGMSASFVALFVARALDEGNLSVFDCGCRGRIGTAVEDGQLSHRLAGHIDRKYLLTPAG